MKSFMAFLCRAAFELHKHLTKFTFFFCYEMPPITLVRKIPFVAELIIFFENFQYLAIEF